MPVNPLNGLHQAVTGQKPDHQAELTRVAKQFESVLVGQLMSVLWKNSSAFGGGDSKAGMYQQMFQGAFAEHMTSGEGIGLTSMIAKGLGATEEGAKEKPALHLPPVLPAREPAMRTLSLGPRELDSAPATGVLQGLQQAAAGMIEGGAAERWSRQGALLPQDLASDISTAAAGGEARFSVRDANGYQGYYKCNLFAFELARRAGLQVPVVAREAGWGFPSSNRVTQDASDGSLSAGWAKVVTGASPAAMHEASRAGEVAFLLVGSGEGERHGHMAIIERPKTIEYDEAGQVRRVVFDGWEAQPSGAKHLQERAWNRLGHPGDPGDRNGLTRIEIIQLSRPTPGDPGERTLSDKAKSSQLDSVSSNEVRRPTQGGKEHS